MNWARRATPSLSTLSPSSLHAPQMLVDRMVLVVGVCRASRVGYAQHRCSLQTARSDQCTVLLPCECKDVVWRRARVGGKREVCVSDFGSHRPQPRRCAIASPMPASFHVASMHPSQLNHTPRCAPLSTLSPTRLHTDCTHTHTHTSSDCNKGGGNEQLQREKIQDNQFLLGIGLRLGWTMSSCRPAEAGQKG